jgi:hypothetical protein
MNDFLMAKPIMQKLIFDYNKHEWNNYGKINHG